MSASPLGGNQAVRYTRFVLLYYFDYFLCCMLYYFDYFLCCTVLPRPFPPPLCSLPRGLDLDPPPPPQHGDSRGLLGPSWGHLWPSWGLLRHFLDHLGHSWPSCVHLGRYFDL